MSKRYISRFLVALFWGALVWGVPTTAWAAEFGTVQDVSEPDARGRWIRVESSAAAARVAADERQPLQVGMVVDVGDRLVTERARVVLAVGESEHITIHPGSDITLRERSVLQVLGEVYYQVRDVFSVQYGTVQTAVEGTEFLIAGGDEVTVSVTEGVVSVSNEGSSVRVKQGRAVSVAEGQAPPVPTRMSLPVRSAIAGRAWALGRPRLQLGLMGSGGLTGTSGTAGVRSFAAVRLLPGVNLVADAGLNGLGGTPGTRLPGGLGLEFAVGGLSIGGTAQVTLEQWRYPCGGRHIAVHFGGKATARYTLALTRRLFTVGMVRVGHSGDAFSADGAVGVGVSL